MLRHPRVHSVCACLVAAIFARAAAQDTAFDSQKVTLQAVDVKTAAIPAGAPSTLLNFVVDPSTSGGNTLDIVSAPGVIISLIQPGNIEVTSANAASLGYEWSSFTPDPSVTILSPFQFPGLHTAVTIPSSAPAGTYTVKANASQTTVESGMMVTYNSDSSLQAGLSSKAPTYRVGETAVLTALLFDNTTPLTGVAASAKLMADVDVTPQATVQNIQMLTSTPAGTGRVREVYTARLLNSGAALTRAQARFRAPATIAVIDGTLFFGEVPTGATTAALNNFTIERKTNDSFQVSALQWFVDAAQDLGQITLTDSGALDAQSGDGLYTGSFVPSTPGRYTALLQATGMSSAGAAFSRSATTSFQVVTPKAAFISFQDQSFDDNANGMAERITISANINVSTSGAYRFLLRLKASNGNTLQGSARATLSQGTATMSITFSSSEIIRNLGINGPFERTDAVLVYEQPDSDTVTVDFRATAGFTPAWALSSFDRGTLYLTGQNSATALSTDGAPLFNVLRAGIGVFYAPGGYCHWSATLSAGQYASYITIEHAYASGMLSPGLNNVTLDFQGANIAKFNPSQVKTVEVFHIECGEHRAHAQTIAQNSTGSGQFRPGSTSFTLSADPVSLTIPAGTSAYVSVTVASPSLFTNQILSTVTGLPSGVGTDIRFPQLSSAPGSFVVHFHAQPSAVPGPYQAIVTSIGGGVQQSLTIPVTITPLSGKSVAASPVGPAISVNEGFYVTPTTFQWPAGAAMQLGTTSPQRIGESRYTFLNWSDGGPISHLITAPSGNAAYVANFSAEHMLSFAAKPAAGGTVTTTAGFYPAGVPTPVVAVANPGYAFSGWSGAPVNGGAQGSITLTQPTILTANFAPISLSSMGLTLVEKYGPASERTWHFSVRNQGTGGLFDVKWFFLLLLQRTGTPCTPVLLDRPSFIFDLKYLGDIPPGGAIPMKVRVNTSNCEPTATFSFTAGFYRNGITTSGVAHGLVLSVY